MRKQRSSKMKLDDGFTAATKRLVKKTLIIFTIVSGIVTIAAFMTIKKILAPRTPNPEVASAIEERVTPKPTDTPFEVATPLPTPIVTPSTAPTETPLPTYSPPIHVSATPTASPTIAPTPTPTSAPSPQSGKTITSQLSLDGFQSSNGIGTANSEIKVGRNNSSITRGFLSFDISSVPSSVNKATLKIYQQGTVGAPYVIGTEIKIDHLNFGSTFEASDYTTSSISSSFATISNTSAQGWKEVEVTQQIKSDKIAGRTRTQFRLHLSIEQQGGSQTGDYALFESGENFLKTGNVPSLIIN